MKDQQGEGARGVWMVGRAWENVQVEGDGEASSEQ